MKHFSILLILFCQVSVVIAQQLPELPQLYDKDFLTPQFHAGRRAALRELMPANTAVVVFANPERNRNNDTDFQYAQNPNFYYLTGYPEPNALLVITKDEVSAGTQKGTEFFFAQERDLRRESVTGRRLGKEGVTQELKIKNANLGKDFANFPLDFSRFDSVFYVLPEGVVNGRDPRNTAELYDLIEQVKAKTKNQKVLPRTFVSMMAQLRQQKLPEEMVLLRRAIDITGQGHREVMKFMDPEITEYQAQAVMEYTFKSYGSEYVGYGSIAGGAENSCILHYITNRRTLVDGDLFLTDCGAEYHGYTADITRTLPVNGKFSPEQKAIYELVLAAQEAGFAACQPNKPYRQVHQAAFKVVQEGLIRLGIATDSLTTRKYFMHGTAHSLGLDVHDAMVRTNDKNPAMGPLMLPNFVTTVEPGIYIPANSPCDPKWWNIGVRIEDDVLVTETGHEVLSLGSPRTVADIEQLMSEKSDFKKPPRRP
ncbi:aminopeptidase P N-terminal domain-containing protein [Arundinibacter roseus]|uniref:Xaa-Pro aminopeptidase n=1 Tax=Arundinibacter roseus TaxID=2070510 RepID=A0A4R4KKG7_9BACT|nr:aminopeptidase P N-terminal domain-containing protein [Arundinibacter roseus]TDB67456.1 M24 family metallopeptidase [Arundinibacter roseus]